MKKVFAIILTGVLFFSCNDDKSGGRDVIAPPTPPPSPSVKNISYNIVASYPHDTASYTEGFELFKGKLYESAGDYVNSALQFGDLKTGKIDKRNKMGTDKIFGEGITILNGKIYQLTYTTNVVYVYDVNDISKFTSTFNWPYEGWGMTNNGTELIITTGGTDLYFVDPATFKVKRTVHIHDDNGPVDSVNELAYVNGFVWGNIYTTKDIVKINPETGAIVGKMNFDNKLPLAADATPRSEVMNGIAYDSTTKRFFVTGKRWAKIYELQVND